MKMSAKTVLVLNDKIVISLSSIHDSNRHIETYEQFLAGRG